MQSAGGGDPRAQSHSRGGTGRFKNPPSRRSSLGAGRTAARLSRKVPLTPADLHARPPCRLYRVQTGVGGAKGPR